MSGITLTVCDVECTVCGVHIRADLPATGSVNETMAALNRGLDAHRARCDGRVLRTKEHLTKETLDERLDRSIAEAKTAAPIDLGSFAQYADEPEDLPDAS